MQHGHATLGERLAAHLQRIYPEQDAAALAARLCEPMALDPRQEVEPRPRNLWGAGDVWMICYGDSVADPDEAPLRTLRGLLDGPFAGLLSGVHILPFFPYSSDHGFAVTDYDTVQPALGDWADIRAIADSHRVMADLVINHCSAEHPWFKAFCQGEGEGADYFRSIDADEDLSAVVRPRTSDLRRPTSTARGLAQVWCTFSHDQVDLDFRKPKVLEEFVRILARQLEHGVRAFRLDAVAFLWKEAGTTCLNLPQTHEIVRLLRTLLEARDPDTILVTETNIPNRENLSYFGNGNNAHIVYNFSLPPLLLHTLWSGSCAHLKTWLMSMPPAQVGTCFLNFLASHDGIGLRPAEGLLSEQEVGALIDTAQRHGGDVSWRSLGGERRPYEINIALFDALRGTHAGEDALQRERFVCAHAIMLGLEGLPAFYIHSLLATGNDHERYRRSGKPRSLNRHQWSAPALRAALDDAESDQAQVLARLGELIRIRRAQPAFHPNATQYTLHLEEQLLGFWRQSMDRRQSIFCISNVGRTPARLRLDRLNLSLMDEWHNLIGGRRYQSIADVIELAPYETVWISNRPTAPSP